MKIYASDYGIEKDELCGLSEKAQEWFECLNSDRKDYLGADYAGWVDWPETISDDTLSDIIETAERIKNQCSLFIVVGIGGSYLGASAVIDALNGSKDGFPDVKFAGYSMSAAYQEKLIRRLNSESTCICVISKSGGTVEPMLSYAILKEKMFAKYGIVEARKRIYVITDARKGSLRTDAVENQFKTLCIPDDIGGRYSVLTPAGLLPIAVSGHDIQALVRGARNLVNSPDWKTGLMDYALSRIALQNAGKSVEVFEYFEANLRVFGEWLQQLFGESEGKSGKGAFPTCLCFSRDLHSMGQFLQQGNQIFYETLISIAKPSCDLEIPWHAGEPYSGKTLEQINECSEQGVIRAHRQAGIPIAMVEIPVMDEKNLGELIYFFEMSAAISAYLLGLNPFDQPGVEYYKKEMKRLVEEL